MIVKKYADGTYNIFYEVGDYVKVKETSKYGEGEMENANKFGEVVKVTGNPVTAKLTIDIEDGQIEEYVFNVVPSNEEGEVLTQEDISKNETITEKKYSEKDYKKIIKYNDFES